MIVVTRQGSSRPENPDFISLYDALISKSDNMFDGQALLINNRR